MCTVPLHLTVRRHLFQVMAEAVRPDAMLRQQKRNGQQETEQ